MFSCDPDTVDVSVEQVQLSQVRSKATVSYLLEYSSKVAMLFPPDWSRSWPINYHIEASNLGLIDHEPGLNLNCHR